MGRQILADLHAEGRLPAWVTGDEVYGCHPGMRAWLETPEVDTVYVLGISESTPIAVTKATKATKARADSALKVLIASDRNPACQRVGPCAPKPGLLYLDHS